MLLNSFALTTDITGALGSTGPVGVTFKWGLVSHEAAEYNGVAGYADIEPTSETGSYFGFVLTLAIVEKINIIVLMPPETYTGYDVWIGDRYSSDTTRNTLMFNWKNKYLPMKFRYIDSSYQETRRPLGSDVLRQRDEDRERFILTGSSSKMEVAIESLRVDEHRRLIGQRNESV